MSTKRALLTILAASAVLLALGIGSQLAEAQPPAQQPVPPGVTIPYPGRLNDAAGQPAPDGAYDFTFTLYAAETGGESLWSEVQKGVPVQGGAFNVPLGSAQPIPPAALTGSDLWLAVAVRGPGEATFTALAPRQRVSATAPAPDSPSAGLACPHDHWGESWGGNGVGLSARSRDWVGLVGIGTTSTIITPLPLGLFGVYGEGDGIGVLGESQDGSGVSGWSTNGAGVRGESTNNDGVRGQASAAIKSGVYGYNSGSGYGMYGRSASGFGLGAAGKDDGPFTSRKGDLLLDGSYGDILAPGILRLWSDYDTYVTLDANNDGYNSFTIFAGSGAAVFNVTEGGSMWAAGSKSALVETADHGERLLYAMESPEVWFEDLGTASLVNGKASVPIEPIFAETVNLEVDYHVFLTPLGDCKGLYVATKTPTSFEVRELGGGTASISFDYRIVAKRRGYESTRLEPPAVRPTVTGK